MLDTDVEEGKAHEAELINNRGLSAQIRYLTNLPPVSLIARRLADRLVPEPTTEDVAFFYEHAGYGWNPETEAEQEGHARSARTLAVAEMRAKARGFVFTWSKDWEVGNHKAFYGADSAYADQEPDTCETCVAYYDDEVVASLGCIDDATPEYRRVVEAELAAEALRTAL
jgi:hypothetical protein